MKPLDVVAQNVDTMTTTLAAAAKAVRVFVPVVATLHHTKPVEPAEIERYRRGALATCARLVPVARQLVSALDDLIRAVEGTYKPSPN